MLSTEKNNSNETVRLSNAQNSRLFISDVHLGAYSKKENKKLENDLIALIDFCEQNQLDIVILGDFFDYWMEYDSAHPPIGQSVLQRFEQFHRKTGSHTLYITGNHDNWTGEYIDKLGFDVEHEYRIICDKDLNFMVLHGDGLQDPDLIFPRPLFNRILRNSYFVKVYQTLLPPFIGWPFMQFFSGSSKFAENKSKSLVRGKAIDSWARNKVVNDDSIQALIYGHHHRPVLWQDRYNICMNCGYFGKDRTAGLYINKRFQIVIWDADNKVLIEQQISHAQ